MSRGRWFIIGQLLILTAPIALIGSAYLSNTTGNGFLPFLALLPYMGIAGAIQLFKCPSCSERLLSIERLSRNGGHFKPKLWLRCPNCQQSFWKDDGTEAEPSKPSG